MAGIQPTSGVNGPMWSGNAAGAKSGAQQPSKTGFGEAMKGIIDKVDGEQRGSGAAIQDLISGKSQDILPVVQAVAKADLSFKLLIAVRNKVIEAYQQTMKMQV